MIETKTPITPEKIKSFRDQLVEGSDLSYTRCIDVKHIGKTYRHIAVRVEKRYPYVVLLSIPGVRQRIRICMSYIKLYLEMMGVEEEEVG